VTGDEAHGEQVYDLYTRGSDLLEHGDFSAALLSGIGNDSKVRRLYCDPLRLCSEDRREAT